MIPIYEDFNLMQNIFGKLIETSRDIIFIIEINTGTNSVLDDEMPLQTPT